MKKRKWYQFSITLPPTFFDIVVGQLSTKGFTGFEEHEDSLDCFIPSTQSQRTLTQLVRDTLTELQHQNPFLQWSISVKTCHEINWNRKWEKSIGVVEATNNIIVKPHWKKVRKRDKGKIIITIDPKMSFGTGHHETTRLSLLLLEKYLHKNSTVLDFGCGTGILSIASAKLGAKSVVAIDNDIWAFENTRENIKKNRVTQKVTVIHGSISKIPKIKYSHIVANIDVPTIKACLPALRRRLNNGGIGIFSGIMVTDGESLIHHFMEHRLSPIDLIGENEWIALAVVKV